MTATASAPADAACSARATVSCVVCAPAWTATWIRPAAASRKDCAISLRCAGGNITPSPVVPEREQPVDPVAHQEIDVRPDRSGVEPSVAERRDGGGDSSPEHRRSL